MSNLQLYSRIYVSTNGTLLAEATECNYTRNTNSLQILTILKGYAGESPGAAQAECNVSSAIPIAGIEFDPGQYMATMTAIELGFALASGQTAVFKGFIIKDTGKHGVGSASAVSFDFRGQFALFQ